MRKAEIDAQRERQKERDTDREKGSGFRPENAVIVIKRGRLERK